MEVTATAVHPVVLVVVAEHLFTPVTLFISLLEVAVSPLVITPNDDRLNDVATISYDLLEIIGAAEVKIEISDLAGRVVHQVYAGDDLVGHYDREWDGTDETGRLVSPGIYLYRLVAGTDRKDEVRLGVINVAY